MPVIELKPCPFCGNPFPTIMLDYYAATWEIRCPECDFVFRLGAGKKAQMKERIIERWNRRVTDNG